MKQISTDRAAHAPELVTATLLMLLLIGCSGSAPSGSGPGPSGDDVRAVPVETAAVRREPIAARRVFSGTLESPARFVVAPEVGGRIASLSVDLGDPVESGQVVARLDDEEYTQALRQAEAELEVARANVTEARANLEIARREMTRAKSLRERGVIEEARLDEVRAMLSTREAGVAVAEARVTRTNAELEAARIRLRYTMVKADWRGDGMRYVAMRHVNEGSTVTAKSPLLTIVELDPVIAVVFVTEKDYGRLRAGQRAEVTTDAYPGTSFPAEVSRVAPAFNRESRQARVELTLANGDMRLKPGMFVEAEVELESVDEATTVPLAALVTREGVEGVFTLDEGGSRARWQPVRVGIRAGDRVQVDDDLRGRVVTLGQQLIEDGSPITVPGTGEEQGTE